MSSANNIDQRERGVLPLDALETLPEEGQERPTVLRDRSGPGAALTLADLRARRAEILRIVAQHGAQAVRVFGSVADGRARPDSDVDLLVEMTRQSTVLDLCDLILDLEALLGCPVHVVESERQTPALQRVARDAVPL